MFNALTDRLSQIMKKMRGLGSLNEKNIRDGLREIRLALLEADVNYKVVKEFIDGATEAALGEGRARRFGRALAFPGVDEHAAARIRRNHVAAAGAGTRGDAVGLRRGREREQGRAANGRPVPRRTAAPGCCEAGSGSFHGSAPC